MLHQDQTETEVPQLWRDHLTEIRQYCPSAIIAGGAVRDLYCGKEVKDIDYFALTNPASLPIEWGGSDIDYEGMKYITACLQRRQDDLTENLVICDGTATIDGLLRSFDFGICQIAYDGFNILVTPAFLWDFKHGVFTLRNLDRIERSKLRYQRINERYSWPLIIGEDNAPPQPTSKQ